MRDRANEKSMLKRRIEHLEALVAAETERADKAWAAYRDTLHECVDLKLRMDRIRAEVNGE